LPEPAPIEVHKVLADDTRYRLYRHLRLSGRPVGIRELSARSSLHPNTLRPHLRRLEEAGLITTEQHRDSKVGRPQTFYVATDNEPGHGYRILAEILVGLVTGSKRIERARDVAREWGVFLAGRSAGRPAARRRSGPDLAALQGGLVEAGFDPRFRRRSAKLVEISLRDCPFRDLMGEHRDLVCAVHRGLLEGLLGGARPPLSLARFDPLVGDRTCKLVARA
jgi:predicted ArsR family transcriptional regulator